MENNDNKMFKFMFHLGVINGHLSDDEVKKNLMKIGISIENIEKLKQISWDIYIQSKRYD